MAKNLRKEKIMGVNQNNYEDKFIDLRIIITRQWDYDTILRLGVTIRVLIVSKEF